MKNIKLYVILFGLVVIVGGIVARFLNNHSFVSDKFIKSKVDSIVTLKREIAVLKDTVFSLSQAVDISQSNDKKYQTVISGLSAENKRIRSAENTCCEELKHAEQTGGIIRDTIRLNWRGKVKKKR